MGDCAVYGVGVIETAVSILLGSKVLISYDHRMDCAILKGEEGL